MFLKKICLAMVAAVCGAAALFSISAKNSSRTVSAHGNDKTMREFVQSVIKGVDDPRLDGYSLGVEIVPPVSYLSGSGAFPICVGRYCNIMFTSTFWGEHDDPQKKTILLHELGHVANGEIDEGGALPSQIRADAFAAANVSKCGVSPLVLVSLLMRYQVVSPSLTVEHRIMQVRAFIRGRELMEKRSFW